MVAHMATKKTTEKTSNSSDIAVIKTGGKQYKVSNGSVLKIEKIIGEYKVGDKLVFDEVLMTDNGKDTVVGAPKVAGAKVDAIIKEIDREAKVTVIHYKQKSRYYKKAGHRQPYFKVEITGIKA